MFLCLSTAIVVATVRNLDWWSPAKTRALVLRAFEKADRINVSFLKEPQNPVVVDGFIELEEHSYWITDFDKIKALRDVFEDIQLDPTYSDRQIAPGLVRSRAGPPGYPVILEVHATQSKSHEIIRIHPTRLFYMESREHHVFSFKSKQLYDDLRKN